MESVTSAHDCPHEWRYDPVQRCERCVLCGMESVTSAQPYECSHEWRYSPTTRGWECVLCGSWRRNLGLAGWDREQQVWGRQPGALEGVPFDRQPRGTALPGREEAA